MCLYKEENWGHCVSNVVLRLNDGAMPASSAALETIGMLSRLLLLALPPRIGKKVEDENDGICTDVNPGSECLATQLPAS